MVGTASILLLVGSYKASTENLGFVLHKSCNNLQKKNLLAFGNVWR